MCAEECDDLEVLGRQVGGVVLVVVGVVIHVRLDVPRRSPVPGGLRSMRTAMVCGAGDLGQSIAW